MSMKNSNDTIRNRTRNLPACSAVPQPTAPPCTPNNSDIKKLIAEQENGGWGGGGNRDCKNITGRLVTTLSSKLLIFVFNPLNTELNPICHLLALLGAYHILHVSRIRVKPSIPRNHR